MATLALALASLAQAAGRPAPAMPGVNVPWVKVNTVGYPTTSIKTAFVSGKPLNATLMDVDDLGYRIPLTSGAFRSKGRDAASGEEVWEIDFSSLTRNGKYLVRINFDGVATGDPWLSSVPFIVGKRPYERALVAAQKMFYYQRTRTRLAEPYTLWGEGDDGYARASLSHVHADVGWLLDDHPRKRRKWPLAKGWHDAGNFDIYVPSAAPAVLELLLAYELNPAAFGDGNAIPESGNKIPDVLDEAAWGLDWILCMQTPEGAFRAREGVYSLGESRPGPAEQDRVPRWVSGIGSASTAKACAALAAAARIFAPFDATRAGAYGKAAKKAWAWLKGHPERIQVENRGSDQPLWDDGKEYPDETGARAAAASAMWRSFGSGEGLAWLKGRWGAAQLAASGLEGGWPNIGRFAVFDMLLDPRSPEALRNEAKARVLAAVEPFKPVWERDGYRCALKPTEYFWGTPCALMEKAFLMLLAARLEPSGRAWCAEAARDQWHWVLGRNPNGYSLVTRVGKGPERIYHMEWGQKEAPPPGYLVDGPNAADAGFLSPGAPAKALLWDNQEPLKGSGLPAHSLWHNAQSDLWEGGFLPEGKWDVGWWVVSEVDVVYNSALVLVASMLQE